MKIAKRWLLVVLAVVSVDAGRASDLPPSFTLIRAVPDDCWMALNFAHNPDWAWLEGEWGRVWEAVKKSGALEEIRELFKSTTVLSGTEPGGRVEEIISRVSALASNIRFRDLIAREFAVAERFSESLTGYDYLVMTRGAPGSAEHNMRGLVAAFRELTSLTPHFRFAQRDEKNIEVWVFLILESDMRRSALRATLFRSGDVIGIVTGKETASRVLRLLDGTAKSGAISDAPRFRSAMAGLPVPEDGILFFDIHRILEGMGDLMDRVGRESTSGGVPPLNAFKNLLKRCEIVDYSVTSLYSEGLREMAHSQTRLLPGSLEKTEARVFVDRVPFPKFDRFVPERATKFSLHSAINLAHLYDAVTTFVETEVPEGSQLIGRWNHFLEQSGFDPRQDWFSWWGGEMIQITLPAAVVTPFSKEDQVLMIRVTDQELARRKIGSAVSWVNQMLERYGHSLSIRPATVQAEGFVEVTHPMMAMFVRPVIGVADGWLMVGSSAGAINTCLDVSAGRTPSIRQNARFHKEGIAPDGPVWSLSFADTSKFGDELAEGAAMMGVVGGMLPMFTLAMGGQEGGEESAAVMQVLQRVFAIPVKLAPALREINFYSSEASVSTRPSDLLFQNVRVITYKKPESKAAPSVAQGDESK